MKASSDQVRTFTVHIDDDGIRLDRWFKRHMPDVSFNLVSRWARTGQLRVDGKRAAPGDRILAGQQLRVPPAEPAPAEGPGARGQKYREPLSPEEEEMIQDMVMARGRDWIMLNKPPGLATQGGTGTHQHVDRLLDGLADGDNRPKLVHRLDKDTSGVLLVAKSARAAAHFSRAFSGRTAKKVYWAIIAGVPSVDDGMIDAPLAKQPGTGGEKMQVDEENGLSAKTRYRVVDRAGNRAAWVELQPLTGRTHQLRAHMAAIGHPIVGDAKYGGPDSFLTGGISRKLHLHARRLKLDDTGGKTIDETAELPDHFRETLATLGFDQMSGDNMPLETPDPARTPEAKAKRAAAHAKAYRKARKGERRSRGKSDSDPRAARRGPGTAPRSKGKPGAKPGGKPPTPRGRR